MSLLDFELRLWIARYLTGEISLAQFRRWLLLVAWRTGEPGAPDSRLVRLVELRLAEYMNGHWTEAELHAMFANIAPATTGLPVVTTVNGPVSTETVQTVRAATELQNVFANA